jgi:hypothetical protein
MLVEMLRVDRISEEHLYEEDYFKSFNVWCKGRLRDLGYSGEKEIRVDAGQTGKYK